MTAHQTAKRNRRPAGPKVLRTLTVFAAAAIASMGPFQATSANGEDRLVQPSRSAAVHRIPLLDEDREPINLDDDRRLIKPVSFRATCGGCHTYGYIDGGWHFNHAAPGVAQGRPAQPWILVHRKTGTQLPLSFRPYPGTWRPSDIGMSRWQFVEAFGRNLPGGGPGEIHPGERTSPDARWMLTGNLEINCLGCHSGDAGQDQVQWAIQMRKQNFKWAATAASGLAVVKGEAGMLPETWDPLMPPDLDHPERTPLTVHYDRTRFDENKKVFVDVGRPSSNRCYYCHTNRHVGAAAPRQWQTDEDVHLAAGMKCVDCHRNGLNHMINRGYEGRPAGGKPAGAPLTCRGCHLGDASAVGAAAVGGRLGAPRPRHVGLPTLHLEKMSCTACHSGLFPAGRTHRMQTSRAHGLGLIMAESGPDALPYIAEPVFLKDADGKIGPYRMVWPAFWARMTDGAVRPIAPGVMADLIGDIFDPKLEYKEDKMERSPEALVQHKVAGVLAAMAARKDAEGEPVYVSGGKLYRRGSGGVLNAVDHPAAGGCAWPLAHDVRPTTQSLGFRSCQECHATDAPIFFGEVPAETPLRLTETPLKIMCELRGESPTYHRAFAVSFVFRPMLKTVGFTSAGIVAAVLILYGFLGLAAVLRAIGGRAR